MKPILFNIPLDQLANNKIDLYCTIILKDVQEVWVSMEEDIPTNKLTGNTKLNITQFGDLPDYHYVFKDANDALALAKDLVRAVNDV